MKLILNLGCAFLLGMAITASAQTLSAHQGKHRPVLVFANSNEDRDYLVQMRILSNANDGVTERDIVVYEDIAGPLPSTLREQFEPEGFRLVLIGKDGGVKYTSDEPVSADELFSLIDAMPMRWREIRDRL